MILLLHDDDDDGPLCFLDKHRHRRKKKMTMICYSLTVALVVSFAFRSRTTFVDVESLSFFVFHETLFQFICSWQWLWNLWRGLWCCCCCCCRCCKCRSESVLKDGSPIRCQIHISSSSLLFRAARSLSVCFFVQHTRIPSFGRILFPLKPTLNWICTVHYSRLKLVSPKPLFTGYSPKLI